MLLTVLVTVEDVFRVVTVEDMFYQGINFLEKLFRIK